MSVALITGSAGLIGSEAVRHFAKLGFTVAGIDNDMRAYFYGSDGSTAWQVEELKRELGASYEHHSVDIRDRDGLDKLFKHYGSDLAVIIHCASQPSHDWAAKEPFTDFDINATGTLNLLEYTRKYAIDAPFIFCSTNKVYGDTPNRLPLIEKDTRWEIDPSHPYVDGIREDMSIDNTLHSIFGASKVASDIMVQEYGRYFDMKTAVFRGGTLTGPAHSAAELHGFLGYVMRCVMERRNYNIYGYKGKQVRDAIHSHDVVTAFEAFYRAPRVAEIYNLGGGRASNISVLESFTVAEEITGEKAQTTYVDQNRVGDHIWWISSMARFQEHYPDWKMSHDVNSIMRGIYEANVDRWVPQS
ncbi:NAD-dependent epimerase/dehydratase family protein [Stackebrandtia nassauensis]|uniref:NAD-dependent epimerase/dehydratase n=1 Tax=Stackebrandtia nassauensis (strain DSM 44728 / CIP 108903 / NRRL B-16338 / NBRC 102104 / LLR-40K-21) TaxID=446470 RepID=D3Q307_STANL|nr:NAD-dependent epimerase/dehydratase family protein [Stackebrandtia nassauensis]ADD39977.1 NAD-dependent epimerase/dehydratase [Stackebrandtia nassauensis DSM 44728]